MTQLNFSGPEDRMETKLPRRDWFLLPLLSLMTIALLAGSTELIARQLYPPMQGHDMFDCVKGKSSPHNGSQGVPNAVCRGSVNDSPFTEYRLNSCGHRAGMECGPKPPSTFRIVMLGTSFAIGEGVPVEKAFPTLLPNELSQLTARKVQLYNEGMFSEVPYVVAPHLDTVLAAEPDAILWILSPHDLAEESAILSGDPIPDAGGKINPVPKADPAPKVDLGIQASVEGCLHTILSTRQAAGAMSDFRKNCLAMDTPHLAFLVLIKHFLYENQGLYVKSYLKNDVKAGFLRIQPSAGWQEALQRFEVDDAEIESQAKAGGAQIVAVLVPNRAQAAMISRGDWPAGFDPYKLDNELRAIITSHGGTYIEILPDFRGLPNPEQYYFPVDAHPNAEGHAIIADILARELTSGAVPELKAAAPEQSR
jgi:hypothetical protein